MPRSRQAAGSGRAAGDVDAPTGFATSTSRPAAGSGPSPGAIASAKARRTRSSAAPSPGGRLQEGAAGAPDPAGERPEQSATKTRKPSTRKLSR